MNATINPFFLRTVATLGLALVLAACGGGGDGGSGGSDLDGGNAGSDEGGSGPPPPPPAGASLSISVGADRELQLGDSLDLTAVVTGGSAEELRWRQVAGPAPVAFDWEDRARTAVTAFKAGSYVLEAEANAGDTTASDRLTLSVTAGSGSAASFASQPRNLRATIRSIGLEWDLGGDTDHDAFGVIRFRPKGTAAWSRSLPLVRIDSEVMSELTKMQPRIDDEPRRFNMLAGSALLLEADTTYELDIQVADPDGGYARYTTTRTTRAVPAWPASSGRRYVKPGDGGGSGTKADPFRGIKAAEAAAEDGDVFELLPGNYGGANFRRGGSKSKPIRWVVDEPGDAVFSSVRIGDDDLQFFGLHLVYKSGGTTSALRTHDGSYDRIVVRGCRIEGFNYGIIVGHRNRDWTIIDNVITGDKDPSISDFKGECVELAQAVGAVVAYNELSRAADGVSYAHRDCDIYGNDISYTADDGIEPDFGYANIRMWGNRIRHMNNFAISFQPQLCGPWYLFYNDIVQSRSSQYVFKFNGQVDRNVVLHNTFVQIDDPISYQCNAMTSFVSRNNLYVSSGTQVLRTKSFKQTEYVPHHSYYQVDWRSDLNNDGFAWKRPSSAAFHWDGVDYDATWKWRSALGIEPAIWPLSLEHDIGPLDRDRIIPTADGNAIDYGVELPNGQRPYRGSAPDLGAHEAGGHVWHYGPRIAIPPPSGTG